MLTMQPNTEMHCKYRNTLQMLTVQPNTEMHCKYSQCNQIQKHAANAHNATNYKNMQQKLITQLNIETRSNNATKYRDTLYVQRNEIQKHTANTYNKPNKEMCCKYSQCNKIQKYTANTHSANKYRSTLQILRTQKNTEIIFITFILPGKEAH